MERADLRPIGLFDGLGDEQLDQLLADGEEVAFARGDVLFREGEHADHWWVLVQGTVALVRHVGREDVVVGQMAVPGVWSGGFRAWDEQGVYLATGAGDEPGRILKLPAAALRARLNDWFPFGVHLVNGLYGTARRIEATARQRDALVTLGRLSAGLAHELNNPAAAAVRSVSALQSAQDRQVRALRDLANARIAAEDFAALDALRLELPERPVLHDALEVADREDELGDWLDAHDVERGWEMAPVLAASGIGTDWCERVAGVLGPALGPGLSWITASLDATRLLADVGEATTRVSELVAAVRSYSQMDRASRQRVDVTEGLDSTLVMLGHKIAAGVEVRREYDPAVPPVDAYPGELNQVWTNLVDNALDAVDGHGSVTLRTRVAGDQVVVEVQDSGPGMAPEVVERAFEAFFTTKDVGQGTGLGLDIARRIIVDRHGGEIIVHPDPGAMVVEVRLPLAGAG